MDNKINLLYNYVYNTYSNDSYTINNIILGKISLNDIKISILSNDNLIEPSIYNNMILYYNNIKNDIIKGKFQVLSFNEQSYTITLKKFSNVKNLYIKIIFYKDNDTINLFESNANNDSLISYILSELVLLKKTKHILLPIINIDLEFNDIIELLSINKDYIEKAIKNNLISNICCLQVREQFFKSYNLKTYIIDNLDLFDEQIFKVLLFQIFHTLAIIQYNFNGFKHNNFLLSNILVYIKNSTDKNDEYKINKNENDYDIFYLPNIGFDIKITNFEHSIIPKYYGLNNNINNDIKTILDDLKNINGINKNVLSFLENIYNELPINILYNKFFDDFKTNTIKKIYSNKKLLYKHNIMNRIIKKEDKYNKKKNKEDKKNKKEKKNDMSGGSIDNNQYKKEQNNPFISNDTRDTLNKRNAEKVKHEQPILLEQKIYDTTKPPKQQIPPPTIPLYDPSGNIINNMFPYSNMMQPPIQKIYNVNLSNPLQNFSAINTIYEDMLPGKQHTFTALTIYERLQLIDFLRNNIIENNDGEDVKGKSKTLLEYIKLLNVNPYTIQHNPYVDLPKDFLIYKAAYPIRYNNETNKVDFAKNTMGMNVRMYKMSYLDVYYEKLEGVTKFDSHLWRELKYYDFVKYDIIKKKVSPNFISSILYKIDKDSKIDWNKIDGFKNNNFPKNHIKEIINNEQKINDKHQYTHYLGPFKKLLPENITLEFNIEKNKEDVKIDITVDTGKTLILLTEAPTSSFTQWSSSIYESHGSIKKMISTGYHSPQIWKSIIFQLLYIFAVLQKKYIYFSNLSLENNFFIKDIFSDSNSIGSWIYKIDDIEYYIPNYGYILMFDSRFVDIDTTEIEKSEEKKFKIYGSMFDVKDKEDKEYTDKIFEQFKEIINPENFKHKFKLKGNSIPSDEIIDFLDKIYKDTDKDISKKFNTLFNIYLHNRVGTVLNKTERENMIFKTDCKKGDLVIYQTKFDEYKYALCKSAVDKGKKIKIYTDKEDDVFIHSIFSTTDRILPNSSKHMIFDDNHIYETYTLE